VKCKQGGWRNGTPNGGSLSAWPAIERGSHAEAAEGCVSKRNLFPKCSGRDAEFDQCWCVSKRKLFPKRPFLRILGTISGEKSL
jgi:hypothetical protein